MSPSFLQIIDNASHKDKTLSFLYDIDLLEKMPKLGKCNIARQVSYWIVIELQKWDEI